MIWHWTCAALCLGAAMIPPHNGWWCLFDAFFLVGAAYHVVGALRLRKRGAVR